MRKRKKFNLLYVFVVFLLISGACSKQEKITYPVTEKVDQLDDYFGTKVKDPYRWLEDDKSPKVAEWVKAQNAVTFEYLNKIPYREKINQRLKEIYNYPRYSSPMKAGEYYFYTKNDGLQNQSVYYVQKGLDGEPKVFLDPNKLSKDGTVRVRLSGLSKDYRYVGVSRSEGGSDWRELGVMEVETGKKLADRIQWVKFSGTSWYRDGFFYSGYDAPEKGKKLTAKNTYNKVYYHKLGEPQSKDKLVYEDLKHPLRYHFVEVTEDEKYLILNISEGTHGAELQYIDLAKEPWTFKPLLKGFEHNHSVIDVFEGKFVVLTDAGAPNSKIVLVDPVSPEPEKWQELIPEKTEVIRGVSLAGNKLFVSYLKDAITRTYQYDLYGKLEKEIEYPVPGSAYGYYGKKEDTVLFYTFTSFTYPPTIYKYDVKIGKSEVFRKSEVNFNPEDYEAKQVFYKSKDGTKVPMFIVAKKGLQLNGNNPAYLYAYGGFNSSQTPRFSSGNLILLENDGIYATACIRGGGEYGEKWHEAGMLLNKQNVFDDFIAAAEYLIKEKYTSQDKLAIAGASNGGLLVGACMTQRPDLFKVAFPAVGVMDMLRYHKFTVGWGWAVEYGSSDKKEHFENLYAYSPLHNIKPEVQYPATLVTTADHDDRVVPAHSFKFIATLQENHQGTNPVLIRIQTRSGHGSSNITKAIDSLTDRWSFMFYNMGIDIK
jgi:prolyl oligopeptidase